MTTDQFDLLFDCIGNGSRGVYRGDKLSVSKLRALPADTIVQEWSPPGVSDDGTKYDLRVFTSGTDILGLASRHFTGQVMEMSSEKSGFKVCLPDGYCCFSVLDAEPLSQSGVVAITQPNVATTSIATSSPTSSQSINNTNTIGDAAACRCCSASAPMAVSLITTA
jgi:hypothetical protein